VDVIGRIPRFDKRGCRAATTAITALRVAIAGDFSYD